MSSVQTNGGLHSASVAIRILGREYRLRGDGNPEHLHAVASYVDEMLREIQRSTPDTQEAAILAALNLASELLQVRVSSVDVPRARIRALIERIDSEAG